MHPTGIELSLGKTHIFEQRFFLIRKNQAILNVDVEKVDRQNSKRVRHTHNSERPYTHFN